MMTRIFGFLCLLSTLSFSLQNNQTIILSSNSTLEYAKTCMKMLSPHLANKPMFILESKSGYFIVTTGIYNNKEEVYAAMKNLPETVKAKNPFRGNLSFDLTSVQNSILYANNLPKIKKSKVLEEVPQKEDKPLAMTKIKNKNFIDAIYLGYGQNWKEKNVYRLGVTKNFENRYFESNTGYVSGFYDVSLNQFEYSQNVYGITFSPVWAYYFNTNSAMIPYIYAGIGGALLSRTEVDEKDFTTAFQFEDRIGMGLSKNAFDFHLEYLHYSNANIKTPNDGMDIALFSVMYNF